jgi:hypothetical protein
MSIKLPESALNTDRHHSVSTRYSVIGTHDIVSQLEDRGFELDGASQANVRKQENVGFQKHLITMKYSAQQDANGVPTVLIRNSHNRSTGLSLYSGYIRFACLNGLISGTDINKFSIRHKKDWQYDVTEFVNGYQQHLVTMQKQRERMQDFQLTSHKEKQFAELAAALRYKPEDYMDYRELGRITRPEDRGNSLWLVFNRVQENLLKGEFDRRIITTQEDGSELETWGKAKIITAQDEIIRINRSLYDLAMKFAS